MPMKFPWCALLLLVAACSPSAPPAPPAPAAATPVQPPGIPARTETVPTARDGANDASLWVNPADAAGSRVFGSGEAGGIEVYSLAGERIGAEPGLESTLVEVRDGFVLDGKSTVLVAADNRPDASLRLFAWDPRTGAFTAAGAEPVIPGFEINGLCLYRSPVTSKDYAFLVSESGFIQQWELYDNGKSRVGARLIRNFGTGFGSAHCTADDAGRALYVAEETTGIWRIAAEPETDPERKPIDMVQPFGQLGSEVKGLAVVRPAGGGAWLVASDAGDSAFTVYELDSGKYAGRFTIAEHGAIDGVDEAEGLHASAAQTAEFPQGVLLAADDDNGDEATNYKLVSWADVARALGLDAAATVGGDEGPKVANILATAETEPVDDSGDAADDPAIWVHPSNPAQSVIIGAQKQRGLYVYDLDGRTLQLVPDGKMNNVDLRYGFELGGRKIDVVAASNRSDNSISLYAFDGATRRLSKMLANVPVGLSDPYGLCMYRSAKSGRYYVFINDSDGRMQQWELADAGKDGIAATKAREFALDSQPEGCVADDETGQLYVGEEAVGIWKYSAEPDGGDQRTQVDSTGTGHLVADVEGMSLWYGAAGRGYLVVSCQGDNKYAVYRREGANEFAGYFQVVANPALGIDGASETDGLDVTSRPLGPRYPAGLFVAQDGRNVMPPEKQNFKLANWEDIAGALQLD